MAAERDAKKPRMQSRPVTPTEKAQRPPRSASTWRRMELDQCGVVVQRDIDPSEMIPQKFFDFSKLRHYAECTHHFFVSWLTILGRADLCNLSREDIADEDLINDSDIRSTHVFLALNEVLWPQPEIRELALAQKRSEGKDLKSQVMASQISSGTSLEPGTHLLTSDRSWLPSDHRPSGFIPARCLFICSEIVRYSARAILPSSHFVRSNFFWRVHIR